MARVLPTVLFLGIACASACVPAVERGRGRSPARGDAGALDDAEAEPREAGARGDAETAPDAEPVDVGHASAADAEEPAAADAGAGDAAPGVVDAAPRDAGARDAGAGDAAVLDAAVIADGGAAACDPAVMPTPAHAGLSEVVHDPACPAGMIPTAAICVDRFEAVLFEVLPDGSTQAWSPFHNPGSRAMRAASIEDVVPQGYINGRQAGAACAAAGKRLCTDTEWLRACRGAANQTYPYGAQRQAGVCNDARARHPAIEYFGTSASWIWSELGNACINQLADGLARTGGHAGCVTSEGAYDMMGNVHEWTSDPAGTFRGGFYVDTVINGNGCLYATTAHDTGHWDYSTGFRCCADRP